MAANVWSADDEHCRMQQDGALSKFLFLATHTTTIISASAVHVVFSRQFIFVASLLVKKVHLHPVCRLRARQQRNRNY
ncbi:hypothetical protein CPC08DRAFT_710642 [Agrocybe pediades]|nr:hypothetical protein CPC08DRAFT_710642 [Agrocybe pediades]